MGPDIRFWNEHFIVVPVTVPAPTFIREAPRFKPGDRVQLDMPGDPNHGRIGTIEVGHPVLLDKPWHAVRIADTLTNVAEIFLKEAP